MSVAFFTRHPALIAGSRKLFCLLPKPQIRQIEGVLCCYGRRVILTQFQKNWTKGKAGMSIFSGI